MFWGITPALDLIEELKCNGPVPKDVNVLIVGGADCRHVFKTLARRYRHPKVRINFYVVEPVMESVAKQLLLLSVALQTDIDMALVQKTRYFMELYGNTIIRPAVDKFLRSRAYELVEMITNPDYLEEVMPYVKLNLKYKERDALENIFKFWCSGDDFNVCESWDKRLRRTLGVRYDCKNGVFEWDLHMRLHSIGGFQVCPQEYIHWRGTGVAFTWLETEVSRTNRSFVCAIIPNGSKFAHCGYLGDMQTGPFIAYGLECEDKDFLRRTNGLNAQRATDVTERNLRQIFYEIEIRKEYSHTKINDINMGTATFVAPDIHVLDVKGQKAVNFVRKKCRKCIPLKECSITFLGVDVLKFFKHKQDYADFFNLIYFGSTYLKYFKGDVVESIAAPKSLLLIENQIFVLSHRDKELDEFAKHVKEKVAEVPSCVEIPCDFKKDSYVKFVLK